MGTREPGWGKADPGTDRVPDRAAARLARSEKMDGLGTVRLEGVEIHWEPWTASQTSIWEPEVPLGRLTGLLGCRLCRVNF